MSAPPTATASRKARRDAVYAPARNWGPGFFVKLIVMALIDAIGVYGIYTAWTVRSMPIVTVMIVLVVVANVVYFSRRMVPAKYILPGMIFLFIFQLYVMVYTAYVAFTNYGQGHMIDRNDAISRMQGNSSRLDADGPTYQLTLLARGDDIYFGVVVDGTAKAGTADVPLTEIAGAKVADGKIASAPDYTVMSSADIIARQSDVTSMRVPVSEEPADGSLGTSNAMSAGVYQPILVYDQATETLTDQETGTVYRDNGRGSFRSDDGAAPPNDIGWRTGVGFSNFAKLFTDASVARPFGSVLLWTVAFAFLSVATTFLLGLFLAVVFNAPRLKGQKLYRVLLILPYAFPGFMSALLWRAMLNTQFGVVNQTLLGGAGIQWLQDPWLAKLSVLFVNLWLGYPYMFLVCTGSLQSIPGDMMESARVDGASPWRQFRSITLPLLFISVAPLLISSFAFNFNNFNLIFMLTGGGPTHGTDPTKPGSTDILISMVYRVAGVDNGNPDYGLATALSIIIFVLVGAIAAWSFRQTRKLEEMA
ncbi:MAG: ABC transporter permease subunit [Bifidobacteriaceae bacterium]|jgi:arabinogalactan oligomer/maltooligosaccharide transport system permease protein|nr:ABC transporter permease subunit [Bifidobacteriaceae bacterium]